VLTVKARNVWGIGGAIPALRSLDNNEVITAFVVRTAALVGVLKRAVGARVLALAGAGGGACMWSTIAIIVTKIRIGTRVARVVR
jgi:hypothetical protein